MSTRIDNLGMPPGIQPGQDIETEKIKSFQDLFEGVNLVLLGTAGKETKGVEGDNRPILPAPDANVSSSDLATLLLKIQMETQDQQIKGSEEYIKANKKRLETLYKEKAKKIEKAIEQQQKAEKASKWGKILGYIALAITAVVAVAACVASGGLAVGPVTCLLLSAGMMILDQTGATGKILQGMAKLLEKAGLHEPANMIVAAVIFAVAVLAVSMLGSWGFSCLARGVGFVVEDGVVMTQRAAQAAKIAEEAGEVSTKAQTVAKGLRLGTSIGEDTVTASQATTGYLSGKYESDSLKAKADAEDIQRFITKIQQQLEDEKDKIQELVEQMESNVSVVLNILKSEAETKQAISRQSV